jgi:hypothetical protein
MLRRLKSKEIAMMRLSLGTATLTALLLTATDVRAGDWDINLGRLCQVKLRNGAVLDCGGGYSPAAGAVDSVVADNAAFRSLMSELGVVFAPNILAPSDTQGFGGYNFAVELGWTMINPKKLSQDQNIQGKHWYWRAAESVSSTTFKDGDITTNDQKAVLARDRLERELPSSFAPTVTVMARKGLWLPVPSFELGVGIRHLIGSRMWGPLVQAKVAIHEGYQGWPLPALSVRGTGVRVMGSPDFNLTVGGLDFAISKHLGIGSTFNLTPYAGYQLLWIVADSEVLDATPGVDAMQQTAQNVGFDPLEMNRCGVQDCAGNFTFEDQSNITRHRVFFGIKANFYLASLLVEYSMFASGSKSDEVVSRATGSALKIPDDAGTQHNISFSVAMDY